MLDGLSASGDSIRITVANSLADGGGGGVSDHGALTGLGDDDHTQYHTNARGDARYWPLSTDLATQAELDAHAADTTSVHGIADTTALETTTGAQTKADAAEAAAEATAAAALSAHEAAANPHPDYLTAAEGDAAYEALGAVATHAADTTSVHGIADTTALETTTGAQAKVDAHTGDTADAHDASAISFTPTGTIAATDVQAAIAEVAAEAGGGSSAPSTPHPFLFVG
jgi:hypothetical protein